MCNCEKFLQHLGQFYQRVYLQLLCVQIPKAQKDSQFKQLFALLGSVHIKAARKRDDEIEPNWLL